LILYALISSKRHKRIDSHKLLNAPDSSASQAKTNKNVAIGVESVNNVSGKTSVELSNVSEEHLKAPPPPPLDTDRLRSATNSDGLLAVLGAAQVLKAMQDGSAKRRVTEAIESIEE
jgi:reverse gyrase